MPSDPVLEAINQRLQAFDEQRFSERLFAHDATLWKDDPRHREIIGNALGSKPPEPLSQEDYQILSLGRPAGLENIPSLPGYNANKTNNQVPGGRAREVVVPRLQAISFFSTGSNGSYSCCIFFSSSPIFGSSAIGHGSNKHSSA